MPLILSGNVASATADAGYTVDNSCRFNKPSDDSLTRTFGSSGNRKTWSFSTWIKRCNLINANMNILGTAYTVPSGEAYLLFRSGEQLHYGQYTAGGVSENHSFQTNQAFRDQAAWYNLLFVWDTTQSTSSDRMKLYVNGTQVTSFASSTYPTLNLDGVMNSNKGHYIGDAEYGTNLDGYLSETIFVDGTALSPTDVGEFDSSSPTIWKPIDVSGLTFGTNGYYLDFEDSADLGADVSGNNNDWTVNNLDATDQATDTPTNNFCTLNPLASGVAIGGSAGTFTEGNLFFSGASAAWCATKGTFSVTQGKWYMEAKKTTDANGTTNGQSAVGVGFAELQNNLGNNNPQNDSGVYGNILMLNDNGWTTNFADGTQWGTPLAVDDGDIVGIALDLDGDNYTFYVNGVSKDSGSLAAGYDSNGLTPCVINYGGDTREFTCNFGNPPYANSSDAADENGYGAFEYAPPSGYYALCTKNLAEYG